MEAPDKIYVKEFAVGISQMWSSIKATKTTANVQHEYIRKDAILGKLKEQRDMCVYRSTYWDFWHAVINQINKI